MKTSAYLLSSFVLLFYMGWTKNATSKQDRKPVINEKTGLNEQFKTRVTEYLEDDTKPLDKELVKELREYGYKGVEWLATFYHKDYPSTYEKYKNQQHDLVLYDKVCGQKDGLYSNLFWHYDLDEAKAQAEKENKLVLSLRMLGDFTEDLSCANSRFFRLLLYSNYDISHKLKSNYVLHVQSVIDVPKITIEYPDGTVQTQTITGNSMHIIMTSKGEIVDALPGLYGPEFFGNWITRHAGRNKTYCENKEVLINYRKENAQHILELREKISETGFADTTFDKMANWLPMSDAYYSSRMSISKGEIERPVFSQWADADLKKSLKFSDEETKLYRLVIDAGFKQESIAGGVFMFGVAPLALTVKKKYEGNELIETAATINKNLTVENIRNEILLHSKVMEYLDSEKLRSDDQAFTKKVYSDVFYTPLDDKKMGMYNPKLFYGITNDGF